MEKNKYNALKNKIDAQIFRLSVSHPVSSPTELPHSVGLIYSDMDVSKIPSEQLSLVHTMLHMFASSKNGKGLDKKSIEQLHSKVVTRLKTHKIFDGLDEK